MRIMYYSTSTRQFSPEAAPGAIAVPGLVYQELMDEQKCGVPLLLAADGETPRAVADLLTLVGLRTAVAREVKAERAALVNGLVAVGYLAMRAGDAATIAAVDGAIAFLRGILADPDVLAVQPGTAEGEGAAVLKTVIYAKWKAHLGGMPGNVKQAFSEVTA